MCVGLAAVEVAPSPKSHAHDVIVPSGSLEPDEPNVQSSWVQLEVRAAVGDALPGGPPVEGWSTKDHIVAWSDTTSVEASTLP